VADTAALVARLGAGVGAVLDDVPDLIAVVAGGLVTVLGAVAGDVACSVTAVAAIFLLATVASEVTEPVTLVALQTATTASVVAVPRVATVAVSTAKSCAAHSVVIFGTFSGEVSGAVAAVAHGAGVSGLGTSVRTLSSEVSGLFTAVAN